MQDGNTMRNNYGCDLDSLTTGSRIGMMRTAKGDLHYFINSVDQGVACSGLPPGKGEAVSGRWRGQVGRRGGQRNQQAEEESGRSAPGRGHATCEEGSGGTGGTWLIILGVRIMKRSEGCLKICNLRKGVEPDEA